ncbi:MAG: FIST N domain protein [archaeon ADurb.Bin336]|nr:MAG: FIST N domain protein [archaeon ADurb.Bin336]
MVFKVGIGTSQNWNPELAAEDAINQALKNMPERPSFMFLYSTIHYENNKGFEKILKKIYTYVPEKTPLVGGTVAGFMNNSGCYTRGITLLVAYSDEIFVTHGIGKNSKLDPKKAAKDCANQIKKATIGEWNNKILINLVASGIILKVPFQGNKKILNIPNFLDPIVSPALTIVTKFLGVGLGREDEILEQLVKELDGFNILGGSTLDDNKWEKGYQFFNNTVNTNSIVGLAIFTNNEINIKSTLGLKRTGIKVSATKIGLYNSLIEKIDGHGATTKLFEKLNWPKEYLNESLHRKTLYYPFCYTKGNQLCSRVLALVVGENLVFTNKIDSEMELGIASGKSLIDSINPHLEKTSPKLELYTACCATLEALGRNTFSVYKKIIEKKKEEPFLLIFLSGEDAYTPGKKLIRLNESFNSLKFF